MNKPTPLGKGLSSLLGTNLSDEAGYVEELAIDKIRASSQQPRVEFAEESLAELATSIQQHGVIQPILVRPAAEDNERYEIIAGERRYRASKQLGLQSIPAVIKRIDDNSAFVLALTENIQRAELSPMEEARAYAWLIENFGYTTKELSTMLGKSRSHISNIMRLLTLPQSTQNTIAEGGISAGHGRALVTSDDPERDAQKIMQEKLSVRDVEEIIRKRREQGEQAEQAPSESEETMGEAEIIQTIRKLSERHGISCNLLGSKPGNYHTSVRVSGRTENIQRVLKFLSENG